MNNLCTICVQNGKERHAIFLGDFLTEKYWQFLIFGVRMHPLFHQELLTQLAPDDEPGLRLVDYLKYFAREN